MAVPNVRSTPSFERAIIAALVLLTATAGAATSRLALDAETRNIPEQYKGLTEIAVTPPFDGARLRIEIDGHTVATSLTAPYTTQVDFGSTAFEHTIRVTAIDPDGGKPVVWTRVINPGRHPLTVKLEREAPGTTFVADITAPVNDPIVKVEFYGSTGLLKACTEPPYRLELTPEAASDLVRVTATTQSGAEATDMLAGGSQVLAQSYDVRTVRLYVSVTDREGQARSDVSADKFEVFDNGGKAKILDVGRAANDPISVALVLDASSSMYAYMNLATSAATAFLQKVLRPDDHCAVFAIQSVPKRTLPVTSGVEPAEKALKSIHATGDTALYDSIATAIRELRYEKARRAIVVLSDGEDTSSLNTFDDLLRDATGAGIPIYFIAFSGDGDPAAGLDQMRYLASVTGGFLATAADTNLAEKYRLIEKELREQYSILYQVSDASRPVTWRRVRVAVKSPQLTARTISGYYTP